MADLQTERGLIFVMVGPGGAGKNAIMQAIMRHDAQIRQLATATTRPMRDDEKQGREHLFVSQRRFQEMIRAGELLEHQEVTPGKFYGIPRQTVRDSLGRCQIRIADIEPLGARELAATFPEHTVQIFVTVPGATPEDQLRLLERRMRQRDDGMTDIDERLERAKTLELPYQCECDYIVVNDDLERAIAETRGIIRKERQKRALPGRQS